MRVTNRMMGEDFLIHLRRNMRNMQKAQNQLASGKLYSRPSDQPAMVSKAMMLESAVGNNTQYRRNMEDAYGWVETTDGALGQMGTSLIRLRELTIAAANGTMGASEFKAIEAEVGQIIEGLASVGNTNFDGRYIFGGMKTTTPPFSVDQAAGLLTFNGDDGVLEREILTGVTIKMNITGKSIMGSEDSASPASLAGTLNRLVTGLKDPVSPERSQLGGEILKQLDGQIDALLSLRTSNGATSNRLEAMMELNSSESLRLTELLSKTEDIDFAEKVMEFAMLENTYKASLSTGAKILQPTLLDYL